MGFPRISVLLALIGCAYSFYSIGIRTINEKSSLLIPVLIPHPYADIAGVEKSINLFLERTGAGIPEYDIRPMDPLVVPEVIIRKNGVTFRFTNLKITGMRPRRYVYYNVNLQAKTYSAVTREQPTVTGDLTIIYSNGQTHSGKYQSGATTLSTVRFGVAFRTDSAGERHLVFGPESIEVDISTHPTYALCDYLTQILHTETLAQRHLQGFPTHDFNKDLIIQLATEVHRTILHNLRVVASILPVEGFFTDIPSVHYNEVIVDVPYREVIEVPYREVVEVPYREVVEVPYREVVEVPYREVVEVPYREVRQVPIRETIVDVGPVIGNCHNYRVEPEIDIYSTGVYRDNGHYSDAAVYGNTGYYRDGGIYRENIGQWSPTPLLRI